ncbi:sensor histidine kinase [Compostimonas suwonensis]|uniref:histidine kinase n=1 Tax=Compostimonas suwonensis TaxID=1048394 RepID=A0A2M9BUY3_9MICO|nr:ATP-binding protein [Compostimonas suwonensis]PJJ61768.1 signal transduction histidine kinase [Compostimonas suwonensis]
MAGPSAPSEVRRPRNPISRAQIETALSLSVGIFGVGYGALTLTAMVSQLPSLREPWAAVLNIAIFGGLLIAGLASLLRAGVKVANGYVAIAYLLAIICWPLVVADPTVAAESKPWLWYLCTVATACAVIAFPVTWAAVYTFVTPAAYGVLRLLPAGGGVDPLLATLDAAYAMILGGTALVIATMLRQAAAAVDDAQGTALDRYTIAVRQHATELERVQVDSIVHDSVLTTFLSAASARTPEARALAAQMASDAMAHLSAADDRGAGDTDETVRVDLIGRRLQATASSLATPFEVTMETLSRATMPLTAADAIYSAAVQAMVNSIQHAGVEGRDIRRTVHVARDGGGAGLLVRVADDGAGFDPDRVPSGRLGLRVSIQERVANTGGLVVVESAPGRGTVVTMSWPDPLAITNASRLAAAELPPLGLGGDSGTIAE